MAGRVYACPSCSGLVGEPDRPHIELSTMHLEAMIAVQVLLVYGRASEVEVPLFFQEIDVILTCGLGICLHICCNSWRVVKNVTWHDGFCSIDHEERRVASRSVRSCQAPEDRGKLINPAAWSPLQGNKQSRLNYLKDMSIGALHLSVRLWVCY